MQARQYPLLKEGQPRRSKNVTLPQRHRRGVGRSNNGFMSDPRFALAEVALHFLVGLSDPSLKEGGYLALASGYGWISREVRDSPRFGILKIRRQLRQLWHVAGGKSPPASSRCPRIQVVAITSAGWRQGWMWLHLPQFSSLSWRKPAHDPSCIPANRYRPGSSHLRSGETRAC